MRLAIVGDIHGHRKELGTTLAALVRHQVDRIVLLGDLFDRGPDPLGCMDLVRGYTYTARSGRTLGLEMVMGNHEDAYVRERQGKAKPGQTTRCYGSETGTSKALTDDEHAWLAALPYVIEEPRLNVICVHGGITPDMTERHHLNERVVRARYLDKTGGAISGFTRSDTHWSDVYDGRFGFVVYGHESWMKPRVRQHSLGLDGEGWGAVHGAILTNERSGLKIAHTVTTPYETLASFAWATAPAKDVLSAWWK
jgi:predicted phosphodiesterase